MALDWQTMTVSLGAGVDTKPDPRVGDPPQLDIARDVQWEQPGGVQTRPPFLAMSNAIFGGGTLSNCRRMAVVNDEICVFTDSALYSWNAQLAKWVLRGTHLAVSVSESRRLTTTDDQVDGDRAELAGTVLYAWGVNSPKAVWVAAVDTATRSMLMAPTALAGTNSRPRLVAIATKILLFLNDDANTSLKVIAIDPAAPATAVVGAQTTVLATVASFFYDVVRAGTQDLVVGAVRRSVTTSYTAFTVTSALSVTAVTKARTADGPLAVATIADGTQMQVVRGNGANIQGDLLTTSTLADVFTGQAIGTVSGIPVNQIAVEFISTTCTVFWSSQETSDALFSGFATKSNTVTTANVVGSEAVFVRRVGVASRAFAYAGAVYVWLAFGEDSTVPVLGTPLGVRGALQNTYFLYRADKLLVSKAVWQSAGGYAQSTGRLPGITASGSTFAWLGSFRRVINVGGNSATAFAARSPVDITFTFDDNRARRTRQLGRTLYIGGGLIMQYDGMGIVEVGTQVYPWFIDAQDAAPGTISPAGTFNWKGSIRHVNAQGEMDRSTTATGVQIAVGANRVVIVSYFPVYITNKTLRVPNLEFWRTVANAAFGSPYYLVTGQDPGATTGDNPFIPNSTGTSATFNDNFSDAVLLGKEANPENDDSLEHLAPPGASILVGTDTRLFLGGIPGNDDQGAYSLERGDGQLAAFNDSLTFDVPPGGPITAIWFQDDVLHVGRATAIYALQGSGNNNNGQGNGFGPSRTVSADVGPASQEAQAFVASLGTLFKSAKGWYLLDRGGGVRYVGGPVAAFDADTVLATHVLTSKHQVHILTNARLLVWDYRGAIDAVSPDQTALGQWCEWTISDGLDATIWAGQYVYLTATGPKIEQTAFAALTYGMDIESNWIKPAGHQGESTLRWVSMLGEVRSDFLLRVRVARDYQLDASGNAIFFDDVAWAPPSFTPGATLQLKHTPTFSRGQSWKVRLSAVAELTRASLVTTALSPQVATSGTAWNATWRAAQSGDQRVAYGEMGNRLTMSVSFVAFTPVTAELLPVLLPFDFVSETGLILVRDHYTWSISRGAWVEDLDNIGVVVSGTVTVADLETAIASDTRLATLLTPDPSPTKVVDAATMLVGGLAASASFTGGAYTAPTGEACRLTSLALELGVHKGINKRLAAGQKL